MIFKVYTKINTSNTLNTKGLRKGLHLGQGTGGRNRFIPPYSFLFLPIPSLSSPQPISIFLLIFLSFLPNPPQFVCFLLPSTPSIRSSPSFFSISLPFPYNRTSLSPISSHELLAIQPTPSQLSNTYVLKSIYHLVDH